MTNQQHPITPPPELVQQWLGNHFGTTVSGEVSDVELAIATQAANWGADQELEASLEWLEQEGYLDARRSLRNSRRPKPPSLKEQPVAEGPSDEELWTMYDEMRREQRGRNHGDWDWVRDYARTVLAKWGHPTPQPVAVSERLPGPGDVNEDGEVWIIEEGYSYALGDTGDYDWEPHRIVLRSIGEFDAKNGRTWLPANALPTPEVTND